jgi:hypothetical protein
MCSKDSVKVKFYFLFLIKGKDAKGEEKHYNEISEEARRTTKSVFPDFKPVTYRNAANHEEWYILEGRFEATPVRLKHYKMRIILEIEESSTETTLDKIFAESRNKRGKFKPLVAKITESFDSHKKTELNFICQVYNYLLVEVEQDYKPKDYESLKEEALTTFFYEVPDSRRRGQKLLQRLKSSLLGPFLIPKTIIRLSRPSVITSRMSTFMRAEVINILYDKALYELRSGKPSLTKERTTDKLQIDEDTFSNMKEYLGKVLFDTEMSSANTEISRSVNILSVAMGIGAIGAILAIIVFIPLEVLCEQNTVLYKSFIGGILLIWAVWILFFALPGKR